MKKTMLMILDGFGISEETRGNAIKQAKTPNLYNLFQTYSSARIKTSGMDVGLPDKQMGNSEVGHINIGAGRVIYQESAMISKKIETNEFYSNQELQNLIDYCQKNDKTLHIMGLMSDGGVHSLLTHLYALINLCEQQSFTKVCIHAFLDGRDTARDSGIKYINEVEEFITKKGIGKIASISGRYYAMDRDNRYERVEKAYTMLTTPNKVLSTAHEELEKSYQKEIYDEFVEPIMFKEDSYVKDKDGIIFFNFRHDRAREITRAFVDDEFSGFQREKINTYYVCMTNYDKTIKNVKIAFPPENKIVNGYGEYISKQGLSQLRIAETEKYAHVTFFFNGGEEQQYEKEDRILIPSPKVATYDLQPSMSAYEVTEKLIESMGKYDTTIINYANCDMVGHTGVMSAAIKAVEVIDECIGKVVEKAKQENITILITADHGNIEQMLYPDSEEPFTAHTTNEVPIILVTEDENIQISNGVLADLAPTLLDIMNIDKPNEMTGNSLLIKK